MTLLKSYWISCQKGKDEMDGDAISLIRSVKQTVNCKVVLTSKLRWASTTYDKYYEGNESHFRDPISFFKKVFINFCFWLLFTVKTHFRTNLSIICVQISIQQI